MADFRIMWRTLFVVMVCTGYFSPVFGITGFRNGNQADPRRQISFNQQGQILSDVQQNHNRFPSAPSDVVRHPHFQNNFAQPSSLEVNRPIQFAPNSQQFTVPQTAPFRPLPSQTSQALNQPQPLFERPIENNQHFITQPTIQPNPQFQQNIPIQQTHRSNGNLQQVPFQVQSIRSSQQIPSQPPPLNSFLPTIPTQESLQQNIFDYQNYKQNQQILTSNQDNQQPISQPLRQDISQIPFQNNIGSNPLFSSDQNAQLQALLEEQRKQDLERLKELQERQKIIQKHRQFLERQQQKQQQKVQKLHEDFILKQKKKQEEIYATSRPLSDFSYSTQSDEREILPHEISLFEKAVKQHEKFNPTSPPVTTTAPTTKKPTIKSRSRQRAKSRSENENIDSFSQSNRQKIYKQLKSVLQESGENESEVKDVPNKLQYIGRQDLLKQLKLALAEGSNDFGGKNFSSREISLPNGEKFEVIRTSDPNLIAGATPLSGDNAALSQLISQNQLVRTPAKQPKLSFEELTKDVLPPGADFEVIKQTGNGKLEDVGKIPSLPDQKKVTFVFIEEQNDGTYQVKGVKGNDDSKEVPSQDVENILQKIKDGKIQFPSVTKKPEEPSSTRAPIASTRDSTYPTRDSTHSSRDSTYPTRDSTYPSRDSIRDSSHSARDSSHSTRGGSTYSKPVTTRRPVKKYEQHFEATKIGSTTPKYYSSASPSSLSINHNGSPTSSASILYEPTTNYETTTPATSIFYKSTPSDESLNVQPSTIYSQSPSTINGHQMYTTSSRQTDKSLHSTLQNVESSIPYSPTSSLSLSTSPSYTNDGISVFSSSSTYYPTTNNIVSRSTTQKSVPETAGSQLAYTSSANPGLIETLKENGLFATAKYLRQSGLDTILNETGPYTVFAPTDKAFRTLLIQLGGPDKAEEKFKENPRLLSGLLLHHVIPGSFEISMLQDEMTGVSLAGTQLRVNQYDMHDVEWNEIKVTTINGARIISDKQDINIPQGIAHAVDRVMFPLPVGDIVQTLQADRERRFTNFLKALFSSGLIDTFSDSKTYTVFAPVDRAFSSLSTEDLHQLVTDKERSKEFVMKHIAPGTLFSAGMRYYQVKDSMAQENPITLQKNAGRIKVNAGHVITHNIPTTNGVIHAIDTLL